MHKVSLTFGWIAGVACFFLLQDFFSDLHKDLGLTTVIEFGEVRCTTQGSGQYSYETCKDSAFTYLAYAQFLLSLALAFGLGNLVHTRKFPPFSKQSLYKKLLNEDTVLSVAFYKQLLAACLVFYLGTFFLYSTLPSGLVGYAGLALGAGIAYTWYRVFTNFKKEYELAQWESYERRAGVDDDDDDEYTPDRP